MISTLIVYDLIFSALRTAGVAYFNDSIPGAQTREALMLLNAIRAEYAINNRANLKYDQTYTATTNKQFITLGTDYSDPINPVAGDIAIRPSSIDQIVLMNMSSNGNNNFPLVIKSYEEYRAHTVQNVYAVPDSAYIDTEFPLQNVYFYPGLSEGWAVRIQGRRYFTDYENIADPYVDPPEYFQMLYLELATRLLGMYGQDVPQGLVIQLNGVSKHIKARGLLNGMKRTRNDFTGGTEFNFFGGI